MKRIILLLIVMTMLFTGCQMTPEDSVVMSKRDKAFEKLVLVEAADVEYNFPDHYQDCFKGKDKNIKITIDADVVIPNVTAYPVVKVKPLPISMEQTKMAADTFMEGRYGYYPRKIKTTSDIEACILDHKARIADRAALLEFCEGDEDTVEWIIARRQAEIERMQKMLPTAPEDKPRVATEFHFQPMEFYTRDSDDVAMPTPLPSPEVTDDRQSMYLIAEDTLSDGLYARFRVCNEYGSSEISLRQERQHQIHFFKCYTHMGLRNMFSRNPFNENSGDGDIGVGFMEIKYTEEEAKAIADQAMEAMQLEDYILESCELDQTMPSYSDLESHHDLMVSGDTEAEDPYRAQPNAYYRFVYRPMVLGIPILRADTAFLPGDEYVSHLMYERVVIRVSNEGVVEFSWTNPMDRSEVINSNVQLLPFDKAMAQAKKYMQISYNKMSFGYISKEFPDWKEELARIEGGRMQINIIKLGMARIPIYNKIGEYMMIPVWNLYGAREVKRIGESWHFSEEEMAKYNQLLMSINAIDGSVIRQRYWED